MMLDIRDHGGQYGGGKTKLSAGNFLEPESFDFEDSLISVSNNQSTGTVKLCLDVDKTGNIYYVASQSSSVIKQLNGNIVASYSYPGYTPYCISVDDTAGRVYVGIGGSGATGTPALVHVLNMSMVFIEEIIITNGISAFGISSEHPDFIFVSTSNNSVHKINKVTKAITTASANTSFVAKYHKEMNEVILGSINGTVLVFNADTLAQKFTFVCSPSSSIMGIVALGTEIFASTRWSGGNNLFQYSRSSNAIVYSINASPAMDLVGNNFKVKHIAQDVAFYELTKSGRGVLPAVVNYGFSASLGSTERLGAVAKFGRLHIIGQNKELVARFSLAVKQDYKL